jgi:ABC-type glycerol-3-phosphate transport system substrate-binding protein
VTTFKTLVLGITALTAAAGCSASKSADSTEENDSTTIKTTTTMAKSNKEKVVELLQAIETGATEPIAYINPNQYTQHNLGE